MEESGIGKREKKRKGENGRSGGETKIANIFQAGVPERSRRDRLRTREIISSRGIISQTEFISENVPPRLSCRRRARRQPRAFKGQNETPLARADFESARIAGFYLGNEHSQVAFFHGTYITRIIHGGMSERRRKGG